MRKHFSVLLIVLLLCIALLGACTAKDNTEAPTAKFSLIVPDDWELEIGDSRSVDYAFFSDVTNRTLNWSVFPGVTASVDKWGRVTAKKTGVAIVTATDSNGGSQSVFLRVLPASTKVNVATRVVSFNGTPIALGNNLQKIVTRYPIASGEVPTAVSSIADFGAYQSATTEEGASWTITDYGVLRTYNDATIDRDKEQRFMGDRYFYSKDTTDGKVLGIISDEGIDNGNGFGIWTIMAEGYTHIEMVNISGDVKAAMMSKNTEDYVQRRGMVSNACYNTSTGTWKAEESDNDGLWTAMYGAGELMRYATLKKSGTATEQEIAEARASAMLSTEAVLLLSNLCMRTGTTEANVRYQPNANYDDADGRYLSEVALVEGGDYSLYLPYMSPSDMYSALSETALSKDNTMYIMDESFMYPYSEDSWKDPRTEAGEYAKRTRNLEGYIVRTYSFADEGNDTNGYIYWQFNDDGTATGVSTKGEAERGYYLNGENLRGVTVDASGEVPARLWNNLIGAGHTIEEIVYKGDTSSDEIIGHLFIYKLAYDILGPEDAELKQIIVDTMERFAQHVSDNGYTMVDGSGQPGTWSKFNREFFYNSSQMGGAPLTSSVVLSLFKLAYYVTGNQKWENEYRMAALHPIYEYAELMGQYELQCNLKMVTLLTDYLKVPKLVEVIMNSFLPETNDLLLRLFLNYSDEEMAMLAFYLLFQMEEDDSLLEMYRTAIDQWWNSMQYSENPLWYYIYQLAYPDKEIKDAYGNNILETAAWSLSRHPIDTRKYCASNTNRDDISEFAMADYGINEGSVLSYSIEGGTTLTKTTDLLDAVNIINSEVSQLDWAVAAPDERALHKYNGSSYNLDDHYNPNEMEGATTYTLPYWLGCYHNMLQ